MYMLSKNIKMYISYLLCISIILTFLTVVLTNTALGDQALAADTLVYGDLNGDGSIDAIDNSLLKQYLIGKISDFPYSQGKSAADVDLSGSVDAIDLSVMGKYLLGSITKLPINQTPVIVIPPFSSLQANAKLPDPFKFMNGTRMTTKDQWASRRAEISALAQAFEYGVKPLKPESVTGAFSSNAITVTCKQSGKTISFKCTIQYPSTGKAPYPAIIGMNMSTLNNNEILKLGVAIINFPADELGQETDASSRGKGKFFDLYGSSYNAGALITWAWGVDRLIDALETTSAANIDPKRLGVTGGSRNGKGALAVGAFDERIILTIPQESGNGGASGWRTADSQQAAGQNVQTLSEIIGENCWFSTSLNQFKGQTNKLPYDHHEIEALCAPRALLVIENTSMEWLGNLSCYNTAQAAHMVYEGLGISDRMGFSQIGGHDHCVLPASQQPEITAYIQKFLIGGGTGNTNIMRTDGNFTFDKSKWTDWTVPSLN
jgi:hypothetical protein